MCLFPFWSHIEIANSSLSSISSNASAISDMFATVDLLLFLQIYQEFVFFVIIGTHLFVHISLTHFLYQQKRLYITFQITLWHYHLSKSINLEFRSYHIVRNSIPNEWICLFFKQCDGSTIFVINNAKFQKISTFKNIYHNKIIIYECINYNICIYIYMMVYLGITSVVLSHVEHFNSPTTALAQFLHESYYGLSLFWTPVTIALIEYKFFCITNYIIEFFITKYIFVQVLVYDWWIVYL